MLKRKQPTDPKDIARIEAVFTALQNTMENLASRWMDEQEYENIAEYQAVIAKQLPKGFVITRMTKRPFGFEFTIGTSAVYAIICSSRSYQWKRIS